MFKPFTKQNMLKRFPPNSKRKSYIIERNNLSVPLEHGPMTFHGLIRTFQAFCRKTQKTKPKNETTTTSLDRCRHQKGHPPRTESSAPF